VEENREGYKNVMGTNSKGGRNTEGVNLLHLCIRNE
jgi:hypothetical protein